MSLTYRDCWCFLGYQSSLLDNIWEHLELRLGKDKEMIWMHRRARLSLLTLGAARPLSWANV